MRHRTHRRETDTGSNSLLTMVAMLVSMLATARATLAAMVRVQHRRAREQYPTSAESTVRRAAQAGTVITVVVIGVVAMVGILIFAQVEDAMPAVDGPLNDSVTQITEGFGNAISFVPIIMLVLLASVVIMVVQRMRG